MNERETFPEQLEEEWQRIQDLYPVLYTWDLQFATKPTTNPRAIGETLYGPRWVVITRAALRSLPIDELVDTLRHEAAHALAGPSAGHGFLWKRWAVELGAVPQAAHKTSPEFDPGYKWHAVCPEHGRVGGWFRKPSREFVCRCNRDVVVTPAQLAFAS